ncbi:hypothetical protein RHSIM_Rhsim05G0079700 [Rhododendron simsii]|uniref:Fe2OG dioxygenase domain-containing protein n=1 Tax=Rhododendron simsii TaxID=118357 RepID=A0A834H8X9_RHOSS|nr:hypothetical protein RHSIM_Rhsim05G0079700 [Rhododendron simsii]
MVDVADSAYFHATEHRPKHAITKAENIPLIDLSAESNLLADIRDASKEWGFFQVVNHGVSLELRRNIESAAREFFAQSKEEKGKGKRDEANPLGYYDSEHTKNVRDWKEVFDLAVESPMVMPVSHDPDDKELVEWHNRWPGYPPNFREACQEYALEVKNLAFKLLQLISMSLGLPENHLDGFFNDHGSFIRINHYPPCPTPDVVLGVGPHKDSGGLTILAQDDVGGLEVKRKIDGAWIRVEPILDAYIVNLGAIMQVWSNDIYQSVEHRAVVNSERERFSIGFFFNPAHHVNVEPLEELIDHQKNPAKYRPYNWGKFVATRRRSNFKKLDVQNIQISDFKINAAE